MAKKKKHPQIFYIGRQDRGFELWDTAFSTRDLKIYKVLRPQDPFDLTDAGQANIIVVDVEDSSYRFHKMLLTIVLARFPNKKIVGLTDNYIPEISELLTKNNAAGYLFRECHFENAVKCLKRIARGKRCFINADLKLITKEPEQTEIA